MEGQSSIPQESVKYVGEKASKAGGLLGLDPQLLEFEQILVPSCMAHRLLTGGEDQKTSR